MSYIPSTPDERQAMLDFIGAPSQDALYEAVPEELKLKRALDIPGGKCELEVREEVAGITGKNKVFAHIFRGAGAYDHYIPSAVKYITSKEEFLTAYTPYQAEISQGVLQSIFEYQTAICELTGMDVSNASVYDGASAAAEAVGMCVERKRVKALVAATANPMVIRTIKTYCFGSGIEVSLIPEKDGKLDMAALEGMLGEDIACVYLQQPNYYGVIEDADAAAGLAHGAGAKLIMGVYPISLGILKTPAEYGADIAVGEGQPLGMPIAFGGPYLGFMASKTAMMRKLPGRIVGQTSDVDGRRAFVLTLQAREQHIRREKASSNICSNQALCAMTASVYLAVMGPGGLEQAASSSYSKAHYAAEQLAGAGLKLKYDAPFFNEFVTDCPIDAKLLEKKLAEKDMLSGLPIDGGVLWCFTEKNSKADIDALCQAVKEAL